MFCLSCQYPLSGLAGNACPECGQTFDPRDSRTYSRWPDKVHGLGAWVGLGVLRVLLVLVAGQVVVLAYATVITLIPQNIYSQAAEFILPSVVVGLLLGSFGAGVAVIYTTAEAIRPVRPFRHLIVVTSILIWCGFWFWDIWPESPMAQAAADVDLRDFAVRTAVFSAVAGGVGWLLCWLVPVRFFEVLGAMMYRIVPKRSQ